VKSISASIIVLAGLMCFGLGVFVNHDDTQVFVCGVGLFVASIGLLGWIATLLFSDEEIATTLVPRIAEKLGRRP
jgi:hypothetical protein